MRKFLPNSNRASKLSIEKGEGGVAESAEPEKSWCPKSGSSRTRRRMVVDHILGMKTPVYEYDPASWGPLEANAMIADVGGWHSPTPEG